MLLVEEEEEEEKEKKQKKVTIKFDKKKVCVCAFQVKGARTLATHWLTDFEEKEEEGAVLQLSICSARLGSVQLANCSPGN